MKTTISQIVSRILRFDADSSFCEDAKSVLLYSFLSQAHDATALVATEAELWRVLDRPLLFTRWDSLYDSALQQANEFRSYIRIAQPLTLAPSDESAVMWKQTAIVFYDDAAAPDPTKRLLVGKRVPQDLSLPDLTRVVLDWRLTLAEKFLFLISILWPHGGTHAPGPRRSSNTSPYLQRFVSLFITKVEDERYPRGFRFTCRDPIFEMLRLFDPFVDFPSVKHHYETTVAGKQRLDGVSDEFHSVAASNSFSSSSFGSYAERLKGTNGVSAPASSPTVAASESKIHRNGDVIFFAWLPWHLAEAVGVRHEGDKLALMRRGLFAILSELRDPGSVVSNHFSLSFLRGVTSVIGEERSSVAESVYAAMYPLTIQSMLIRGVSCNYRDHAVTDEIDRWAQCVMEVCKWIYGSSASAGSSSKRDVVSGSDDDESSSSRRAFDVLLNQLRRILKDPLLPCVVNSGLKWITQMKPDDYAKSHASGETESAAPEVVKVSFMSAVGLQRAVAMNRSVRDHVLLQRLGGELVVNPFVCFYDVTASMVARPLHFFRKLIAQMTMSASHAEVRVADAHVDGRFSAVAGFSDALTFYLVQSLMACGYFTAEPRVPGLFQFHEAATMTDLHRFRTAVFFSTLVLQRRLNEVGLRGASPVAVAQPLDGVMACLYMLFGTTPLFIVDLMYPVADATSSTFKTRQRHLVRSMAAMLPSLLWTSRGREWSDAAHLKDASGKALFPRSVFTSPRGLMAVAWVVLLLGMRLERAWVLARRDQAASFLCRSSEGPMLKSLAQRVGAVDDASAVADSRLPSVFFADTAAGDLKDYVELNETDKAELAEWVLANAQSPALWTIMSCLSARVPLTRQQFTQVFGVLPPATPVDAKVPVWSSLHLAMGDSTAFRELAAPLTARVDGVDEALRAQIALCFALAGTNLHVWMRPKWSGKQMDCFEKTFAYVKAGTVVATPGFLQSTLEPMTFFPMKVAYSNGSAMSPLFESLFEETFPGCTPENALPDLARTMLTDLMRPVSQTSSGQAPVHAATTNGRASGVKRSAYASFPSSVSASRGAPADRSPAISPASWADASDGDEEVENAYVPL